MPDKKNLNGIHVKWSAVSVGLVIISLVLAYYVAPLGARVDDIEKVQAAQGEWNSSVKEDVQEIKKDVKDLLKQVGN